MKKRLLKNFYFIDENPMEFDIEELFKKGIKNSNIMNAEKMVIRPSKVRGFWIHNSNNIDNFYKPISQLTNYSIILHLGNSEVFIIMC